MLARFRLLPVLLFVLFPLAALADESPATKEKPKLEEPPITIVYARIVPVTVLHGRIVTGGGPGTNFTSTQEWSMQVEVRVNRRVFRVDGEVRCYDKTGKEIFDPKAKAPKGPSLLVLQGVKPGQMGTAHVRLQKLPGIALAKGKIVAVRVGEDDKNIWYPPKDAPMTFEAKVPKQAE